MKNSTVSYILIAVLITLLASHEIHTLDTNKMQWELIFKNDKDGNIVFGDKGKLIAAIRGGVPVRIGWASQRKKDSTKTVEHVVYGEFVTIANGKEVFAQIKPFLGQRPVLTGDTLSMNLLPNQLYWVLSTNGSVNTLSIDYAKDTVISTSPRSFGRDLSWYIKIGQNEPEAKPLWN